MPTNSVPESARAWRLQDAKAQFSALVDSALRGVPQHVTRRGKDAVVVVSAQDYAQMQRQCSGDQSAPASLVAHLLAIPKEATGVDRLTVEPRHIDFS